MQKEIKRFNRNVEMYVKGLLLITLIFVAVYVVQQVKNEEIRSERIVIER